MVNPTGVRVIDHFRVRIHTLGTPTVFIVQELEQRLELGLAHAVTGISGDYLLLLLQEEVGLLAQQWVRDSLSQKTYHWGNPLNGNLRQNSSRLRGSVGAIFEILGSGLKGSLGEGNVQILYVEIEKLGVGLEPRRNKVHKPSVLIITI